MRDTLISYETAKLAKEKGFPKNLAYDYFLVDGKTMTDNYYKDKLFGEHKENLIPAPTQTTLQKWLREKHNIVVYVEVISSQFCYYRGVINTENENGHKNMWSNLNDDSGSDYEEVLELALIEGLKKVV